MNPSKPIALVELVTHTSTWRVGQPLELRLRGVTGLGIAREDSGATMYLLHAMLACKAQHGPTRSCHPAYAGGTAGL